MSQSVVIAPLPGARFSREYAELKSLVKEAGLLEKQPISYALKIALVVALFLLGILVLLVVHPFWLQLLNAVYLAFVTTQLGLLGHDAGHLTNALKCEQGWPSKFTDSYTASFFQG